MMLLVATTFGLHACTGDSGEIGPTPSRLSLQGLWEGNFLGLGNLQANRAVAVVLNGGRLMMLDDNDIVYAGDYRTISSIEFAADVVTRYGVSGAVSPPSLRMQGRIINDPQGAYLDTRIFLGNESNPDTIQLRPNPGYARSSGLSQVAGTWVRPFTTMALTIQSSNGSLFGQQSPCFYSGSIGAPDPERNLYLVNMTISPPPGCDAAGEYSGFAYLEADNQLHMMIGSSGRGHYFPLILQ